MDTTPRGAAWAGLAALAVAMGIGRFAFTPILPMMQAAGSIDLVRGGWLASTNYAGYLAGGLIALAWPWSSTAAIRAGLAIVAATTLAMDLPVGIAGWLALRAASGVASAWVLVFTSAAVLARLDAEPHHERQALAGRLYAGVGVGIAIAGVVCALALGAADPASASWLAVGGIATACTIFLWKRFPSTRKALRPAATSGLLPATALPLAACYAVFGFGYIVPATFLSAMAREASHGGPLYALSWPLFGLAAATSTWLVTRLGAGRSPRGLWSAGHVAMAVGVATAALSNGIAAVFVCGLLVGGTFMVVTMAGMQEARRIGGAHASRMMALMTTAFAAGQIAGPLLVSALASRGLGYAIALWLAAGLLAVTALFLHLLPKGSHP